MDDRLHLVVIEGAKRSRLRLPAEVSSSIMAVALSSSGASIMVMMS